MTDDSLQSLIAFASGVVALVPIVALSLAYRRTKSRRIALALVAFTAFLIRGVVIAAIHFGTSMDHATEHLIEFGSDALIITLFALAFLHGSVRPFERGRHRRQQDAHPGPHQG
jgi:uncharacterized membrane protein